MDDHREVLTQLIKRQMAILGPQITLAKVRSVPGIQVDENGNVTNMTGDPQMLMQQLINQFVELSGLIVKKTMESIMGQMIASASATVSAQPVATQATVSAQPVSQIPTTETPQNQNVPTSVIHNDADNSILSANRDIEDLNKMLNNINYAGNSK